ncbi:MAG: hypothetical protein GY869_32205 [Planctomycetes bacterium]|nr:hypothetical protein [Planctomycetota bacterium]
MKIPEIPPNEAKTLGEYFENAGKKEERINLLLNCGPTDSKGRYLHWDELTTFRVLQKRI